MSARRLAVAVVLLLAVAGAGAGVLLGVGPFGDSDDAGSAPAPPAPDATTATSADSDYAVAVRSIESCGTTCREVTAALSNEGPPRRNVTVATAIYADGDRLWADEETVGRLDAGETHTTTKRVTVGLRDGLKIRSNDGYVTLVTVVRSEDGVERFSERRQVA